MPKKELTEERKEEMVELLVSKGLDAGRVLDHETVVIYWEDRRSRAIEMGFARIVGDKIYIYSCTETLRAR